MEEGIEKIHWNFGFDVVTGERRVVRCGMLASYLVMSVITIFVCNTRGRGPVVGRRDSIILKTQ